MPLTRLAAVDAYLDGQNEPVRAALAILRERLHALVPHGEERISYGLPTAFMNDRVVCHLGGFSRHVSIFPIPPGTPDDEAAMAPHRAGKGTLRFEIDRPLPLDLVDRIITLHVERVRAATR